MEKILIELYCSNNELNKYKIIVNNLCKDGWFIEHQNWVIKNMANKYYYRLFKMIKCE